MCPCCRTADFTRVLDKRTRGTVLGLRVQCENRDCYWTGQLIDLRSHISGKCPYTPKVRVRSFNNYIYVPIIHLITVVTKTTYYYSYYNYVV